jgi:hypothetical protein
MSFSVQRRGIRCSVKTLSKVTFFVITPSRCFRFARHSRELLTSSCDLQSASIDNTLTAVSDKVI